MIRSEKNYSVLNIMKLKIYVIFQESKNLKKYLKNIDIRFLNVIVFRLEIK